MPKITGAELAALHGARVVIGPVLKYDWRTRIVTLPASVARGSSAHALVCAAHEAAHHRQHVERPLLMWWLWRLRLIDLLFLDGFPFRDWIEVDAWRRAEIMLRGL